MKRYACIFPFVAMIVALSILLSGCKKKDEEEVFEGDQLWTIVGAFEFRSANFQEMLDLDGDGPMAPTTNALDCLYDIFNIYAECSSIEPLFTFTIEKNFNQYCKETGQTRVIGHFTYSDTDPYDYINIRPDEWPDPYGLYEFKTLLAFRIEEAVKTDGLWNFKGTSDFSLNAYPDVLTVFDFELQEVVIED